MAVLLGTASVAVLVRSKSARTHRLIAAANSLDFRAFEGRLAGRFTYRPYRQKRRATAATATTLQAAADLLAQWKTDGSVDAGRLAADAFLVSGKDDSALSLLSELLRSGTSESDLTHLIQKCGNATLLTDFSAAQLQRSADRRSLLLAYEAADKAWRLSHLLPAAWNRALAADRIGMSAFAARAWQEVVRLEPGSGWAREADMRRRAAARRAAAAADPSLELFFYRELIGRVIADEPLADVTPSDHLASDVASSLPALHGSAARQRLVGALNAFARGREAFERSEYGEAQTEYAFAEGELGALHLPLALIARDQRIRSQCSQAEPGCLESMRDFRREVSASGRYPWLAARAAYGEGQTLYRQGRVFEAADHLQRALQEFEKLGDSTSVGYMHVLLGNVAAAAGETDLSLQHYLASLSCRTPQLGDRRRKMLQPAMMFMLRHGFLATTELLLDEMAASPASDATTVTEWMLRGVVAFRRGDLRAAQRDYALARELLRAVKDDAERENARFELAIAEAGSRMPPSSSPIVDELNAAIAAHERREFSIWLPQLLSERAVAYEKAGDATRAESDDIRAIAILESRQPRIDETVLALGIASQAESPFDRAIRRMMRQGRIADALSVAQRADALYISSSHARGAGVRDPFHHALGNDGVADLRSRIQSGQVVVAHHLLRNELITWIVGKDEIRAVSRPVGMDELSRQAERLRRCAGSSCGKAGADAVESLSDALLRGWIDRVPRGATLIVQPPAQLQTVPLAMLRTSAGERLASRNPLSTIPTFADFARALSNDAARPRTINAFFAAAPSPGGQLSPLPLSIREVRQSSRSYARRRVDAHATRAVFLKHSPAFAIVHFAGHIVVSAEQPLFSALVFGNGELLYVHELDSRSFSNTRLVVLSGCESGRSPQPTMSMANALLAQGVPSAVYTLWPISDEAAAIFAIAFHRSLAAGGSRAAALRDAQLVLMEDSSLEPFSWAAFALAGAPGPLIEAEKGAER
jgi:tetratricopeptide (TPR) repeat protein